ncbi:MAG: PIN domain-containing protein [Bacteroidota bacterium]
MKYVLDSNILIHYSRQSHVWRQVQKKYITKGFRNSSYISFAADAEANSFSKSNNWGSKKLSLLQAIINQSTTIHSNFRDLKKAYIKIDLYSQNRHKSLRLPKEFTVRNMGKNDLWIAATAYVLQIPLISTDKDFQHLDGIFFDFIYINPELVAT